MNKNRVATLAKKATSTLKDYGISGLVKKTKTHLAFKKAQKAAAKNPASQGFKDILFISGCNLPHPERYRVDHQIEQLEAYGLSCDKVFYINLKLDQLKFYHGFVFYRCPILPLIKDFIKLAKENHKTVFFDIDDLVFDTKYTNKIPYVQSLKGADLDIYNDGVNRMGETLKLCDYGIASTTRLQTEMEKVLKKVYVNRNVASSEMVECSEAALASVKRDSEKIILGYFSGTITHNADFALIMPVLIDLLQKHENLYLKVVGLLDLPPEMEPVKHKIISAPFVDWRKLPELIRSVDVNLVPLEQSVFNEAKSENKWTEASLVKVPTIASKVGALAEVIEDGKTGLLCDNTLESWRSNLENLIASSEMREYLATTAHEAVLKTHYTLTSGSGVADFIRSKLAPSLAFVLPSTNPSGGIIVATKHAELLKKNGYDVTLLNAQTNETDYQSNQTSLSVVSAISRPITAHFDTLVATMWLTLEYVLKYPNVSHRKYLVQNLETGFYTSSDPEQRAASATYAKVPGIEYITISEWCRTWLAETYGNSDIKYAPNGIDANRFKPKPHSFTGKIKILVEGSSSHKYKNVDESFRIVEKLDPNKFEIHYLSYDGKAKSWYRVDREHYKVPPSDVHKVYESCDILLKSSLLESFSYPPLEMMATGGFAVVAPNAGNSEYLADGDNCLLYEQGNIDDAVAKINQIVSDKTLRKRLATGADIAVHNRNWRRLEPQILALYK